MYINNFEKGKKKMNKNYDKERLQKVNDFQERVTAAQKVAKSAREQHYNLKVNPDGTLTMYHGTSINAAMTIKESGKLEKQAYLSPNKKDAEYYAKTKGKGGDILAFKVDARDIEYSTGTGEVYVPSGLVLKSGVWQSPNRGVPGESEVSTEK